MADKIAHQGAYQEIATALEDYFDGLYHGDTAKMRKIFMPQAHLFCAVDTPMLDWSLDKYMEVMAGRESPASQGKPRHDRILSIDVVGPQTAIAKVECAIPPRYFTDLLTMVKVDGAWRIINKTFHYVVHE